MLTVNEVSKLAGVSVRTLQYYDKIGLLKPTGYTESGYRLYDDTALESLQQILLFRELQFSLKEIREIISGPDFNRNKALEQQIELLTMKKEHLEHLIAFARGIQLIGVRTIDFSVFDTKQIDEYMERAKEQWGKTAAYQEFEQKAKSRSEKEDQALMEACLQIFAEFGALKDADPASANVQSLVKSLQAFFTENFYKCTKETLFHLGEMYAGGGAFTENIDSYAGTGTAKFTARAIQIYCSGPEG